MSPPSGNAQSSDAQPGGTQGSHTQCDDARSGDTQSGTGQGGASRGSGTRADDTQGSHTQCDDARSGDTQSGVGQCGAISGSGTRADDSRGGGMQGNAGQGGAGQGGASRGDDSRDDAALVLVIEHEPAVAELARRYLARDGLPVRVAGTPADAVAALRAGPPAVVVLDLTMPGLTASFVRRKLTPRGQAGGQGGRGTELVCLAGPGGLRPRHVGIAGEGDPRCVTRPFSPRVLVARVRAAMRRPAATAGHSGAPVGTCALGDLVLDTGTRRASVAGADVRLTATEFALLAFLAGNAGRVVSRRQLLGAVGGTASVTGERSVDVHIAQLRAKLGAHSPIRTIRGVGYLAEPRIAEPRIAEPRTQQAVTQ